MYIFVIKGVFFKISYAPYTLSISADFIFNYTTKRVDKSRYLKDDDLLLHILNRIKKNYHTIPYYFDILEPDFTYNGTYYRQLKDYCLERINKRII